MLTTPKQVLVVCSTVLLASCGAEHEEDDNLPSCAEDTRDDEYVAGISKTGEAGYTISLIDSVPAPPTSDDNLWTIEVQDGSGAMMTALEFQSTTHMPDHKHGSPVDATSAELGEGRYTLDPVNLFMAGYWEITIEVQDPGETASPDDNVTLDTVMFKFCVEG